MRENRSSGSEGGEPQLNAACLPLSGFNYFHFGDYFLSPTRYWSS